MAFADHDSQSPTITFDAADMLGYFSELDQALFDSGTTDEVHLVVAGGAVIATKFTSRLTTDVDVISEGMTPQLRSHVAEISRRHPGLRSDWLNDAAKLKRVSLPIDPERIYTGKRLIIDSAGDRYILAMKLASCRQIDQADCEILIRCLRIRKESEMLDLIERSIPAHLRTPAMRYFATECLQRAYPPR